MFFLRHLPIDCLASIVSSRKCCLNVNACGSWSDQMDSVNIQCDPKVRLQETSNKGNKQFAFASAQKADRHVWKVQPQNGVLCGVKGEKQQYDERSQQVTSFQTRWFVSCGGPDISSLPLFKLKNLRLNWISPSLERR